MKERGTINLAVLLLLWLCLSGVTLAEPWFPPSASWLADRLRLIGFENVNHKNSAFGGLRQGLAEGPILILSSNDPVAALDVIEELGRPAKGSLAFVFGPDIQLKHGDFLIKLDFAQDLGRNQVALPSSGPSIDLFEIVISEGKNLTSLAVASDLILTLQNRARTASELVLVQLEHFRPLENGNLAIDLSLRVFDPTLRKKVAEALEQITKQRLKSQGSSLISLRQDSASDSGQWPSLRTSLGDKVQVLQEDPPRTPLSLEDFGRPGMPSLTIRVGPHNKATSKALASLLDFVLNFER